jgi:hypothetical protein
MKIRKFCLFPRNIAIALVTFYQRLFSPDHSFWSKAVFPHGYCKYTPSCSEYSKLSFKKNGLILGALKSFWRVLRCNPWSKGGMDLP